MTEPWTAFLEIFRVALFWLTQFYGGQLGPAIISFSLVARVAMLPLTVRLALRARAHARRLQDLRPRLEAVRTRWKDDPERVAKETLAVYSRAGVSPLDGRALRGALLQSPVFIGMYQAVRSALGAMQGAQGFLWISNLARPDVGVALLAAALGGLGAAAGASYTQPTWTLAIPAVASGVIALFLSAGFGLYLVSTGAVVTLQGLIVRRVEARASGTA